MKLTGGHLLEKSIAFDVRFIESRDPPSGLVWTEIKFDRYRFYVGPRSLPISYSDITGFPKIFLEIIVATAVLWAA
jgi:hypothetical protein